MTTMSILKSTKEKSKFNLNKNNYTNLYKNKDLKNYLVM